MYSSSDQSQLPELVRRAVSAAEDLEFELCVHPGTGRLLQVLAAGLPPLSRVGEAGTGTGAGLAWMASLADPSVEFVSYEIDAPRADAARTVFDDTANVTVIEGDSAELGERGPFDLLVLDGGWGGGKDGTPRADVRKVLTSGGIVTIDDFTPATQWPPTHNGVIDQIRIDWLTDSELLATEIRVAPSISVLVCRRTPGRS